MAKIDLENYTKMSTPFETDEAAEKALKSFLDVVEQARKDFRISDVHIIVKMNVMHNGFVGEGITNTHFGNSLFAATMCAWALGQEQADINHEIQKLLKP
jgi:hypothetical protein